MSAVHVLIRSNNTNKLSPQEPPCSTIEERFSSNNTNKLSPQEHPFNNISITFSSNNTNKLSPQEQYLRWVIFVFVQIIQINLVLKNSGSDPGYYAPFK